MKVKIPENLKKKLKEYNQEHLLLCFDKLDEEKKKLLIEQIEGIDFDLMKELYENTMKPLDLTNVTVEPIEHVDKSKLTLSEREM